MSRQYQCPVCLPGDFLEVLVTCWVTLFEDDDDNLQTTQDGVKDASHCWSDNSLMQCQGCGHVAKAELFNIAKREEELMTDKKLMTDKEFAADCGNHCPHCSSHRIEAPASLQSDADSVWQDIFCLDCGKEWRDLYKLIGWEPR